MSYLRAGDHSVEVSAGGYIDDALDTISAQMTDFGPIPSGLTIEFPPGLYRIKRSHKFTQTGIRLRGAGGRYCTRIVADRNGDYPNRYLLVMIPAATPTNDGAGIESLTLDCNGAPATGLVFQGAYDTSVLRQFEVLRAHDDYAAMVVEPAGAAVVQTLHIDTCHFSKANKTATGHTVIIRKAQECMISNSKLFGGPSNTGGDGAVPLLLEDVRGVQLIGGGYANSRSHLIEIHAKTRSSTHISIISPTFEGYIGDAIKTHSDDDRWVSRLTVQDERLIRPFGGLLLGDNLSYSRLVGSNAAITLGKTSRLNRIDTWDTNKITDNGTSNTINGLI